MEKEVVKQEADKMKQEIEELIDSDIVENVVSDNKIEFEFKDQKYRVSLPTFEQKQKTLKIRIV